MPGYAQKLFVWQRVIIKTTITEREFEYKQINLEGLFTLSIARIQQDFVWEYHIRSLTRLWKLSNCLFIVVFEMTYGI
ncbi:hypothetical protein, partial [Legionella pneumophila]